MHIGVDASRLVREKRGMGRYVRNLLREIPLARSDVWFTLYASRGDAAPLRALLQPLGSLAAGAAIEDASGIPESRADVMWYPWNFVTPLAKHSAIAVTIHDIVPMIRLDHRWWKVWKRAKYRRRYTNAVRWADAILADSRYTAQEIKRVLHADMSKVHEVLLASDDFAPPAIDSAQTLEKLGVSGPFFMAVGAHEARKNLPVLFEAMRELDRRGNAVPLVLCGPGARLSNAAGAHADHWLKYAGFVSDSELASLYKSATALIFPSLYEGFGLPPLEAMQCGGRVLCANASSLPQVVGDAALMFPPRDVNALVKQMERILADSTLRDGMTQRGLVQAAKFRWSKTAQRTLAAFDAAIARRASQG
jgi:glycosyltransferase involved in cell wall biosynthesis